LINREIIYERNLTGSYMKIPVGMDAGLDEKLMLRRKLPGLLPVEKAYIDGSGQYWYNISGRQSLDTYCRVRQIGMDFIERLIISICSELEILEWNLIHTNCLMLDPELIFIANSSREFIFTVYPCGTHCVETEFQQMMEYLLTRVDHKDTSAVRAAYDIYEKTLQEGYSVLDIRDGIMKVRQESAPAAEVVIPKNRQPEKDYRPISTKPEYAEKEFKQPEPTPRPNRWKRLLAKLAEWGFLEAAPPAQPTEKSKKKPFKKASKSSAKAASKGRKESSRKEKSEGEIIYPQEEIPVVPQPIIRPTVCLNSRDGKPRGFLLYQGRDQLEDISLGRITTCIGNGSEADVLIDRDTISKMHARIDHEESTYYIEDLNSTNGTFVNEEPLIYKERRKLQMNDIVSFADIRYRFT
jgi:hypothetical protein